MLTCIFIYPFTHTWIHLFEFNRGMVDESGDQFVAYFMPTEETTGKRKRDFVDEVDYVPEEEYVCIMILLIFQL